jgi:hypothetical protein
MLASFHPCFYLLYKSISQLICRTAEDEEEEEEKNEFAINNFYIVPK